MQEAVMELRKTWLKSLYDSSFVGTPLISFAQIVVRVVCVSVDSYFESPDALF